ncbi:hypothetical protein SAMD00019534_076950 [Acytostelium subglobosum LB1]|uniref:hypothetical protein n=1 Tax=Acytostelium subglobosum LB1 TaxID=1410327 RepID=UPI000644E839|nr:hypothetical protein SAMD00019534_076950 [Acytostelium subglobosum LB1]GAM24520.1 hypothetical protein SAMD00019534_076950 [Acytostelium subglobosum LB1]|eukprot:XP_012752846.1 hypothetical protein SAMD00019534_076950 [Acytostelium subglobosum LB1]
MSYIAPSTFSNNPIKVQFDEVIALLDQVHQLIDNGSSAEVSKASSILKSILPLYKEISSNEESKTQEGQDTLQLIKLKLTEETNRVLDKRKEAKKGALAGQPQTPKVVEPQRPPLLQGYLKKQGEKGIVKTYKRRWFQQKDTKLYYYEKEGDTESYGFINLPDMLNVKTSDTGFELVTPGRTYVMQVFKPSDLNYWTEGLKEYKKYFTAYQNSLKLGTALDQSVTHGSLGDLRRMTNMMNEYNIDTAPISASGGSLRDFRKASMAEPPTSIHVAPPTASSNSYSGPSTLDNAMRQQQQQQKAAEEADKLKQRQEEERERAARELEAKEQSERMEKLRIQEEMNHLKDIEHAQHEQVTHTGEASVLAHATTVPSSVPDSSAQPSHQSPTQQRKINQDDNNNHNNTTRRQSITITPTMEDTSPTLRSPKKIDLELNRKTIEEEVTKRMLVQQEELLEIERQRRAELENEILKLKDIITKQASDERKKTSIKLDLQLREEEIDRLKKNLVFVEAKVVSLENQNAELTKSSRSYASDFPWAEEIANRDKTILALHERVDDLSSNLKLKENAVSVIRRENEMLREETEKKDRYISSLVDRSRSDSKSSQRYSVSGDVTKLRESALAHQSQNSFLAAELKRLETDNKVKLEMKDQRLKELEKLLNESVYNFQSLREMLHGASTSEYCGRIEKENQEIKREYFLALGVSIKLHRSAAGQPTNVDVQSLYEEVVKSSVPVNNWPEWDIECFGATGPPSRSKHHASHHQSQQ